MDFVHLHTHSAYSLLDGQGTVDNLIAKAKELGQKALAITDHGNMYGVIDFYKKAVKEGIKPILGCEVYVCPRSMYDKTYEFDSKRYHLILLAKNNTGYKNLVKIVSLSNVDGFYIKPRVDKQTLLKYSEGLICLSGCMAGEISQHILNNDMENAEFSANEYLKIFGKENFYIELQNHQTPDDPRLISGLVTIANKLGLKTVATNDVHYTEKKDSYYQDVLMCIQTHKTVTDTDRLKFLTNEFYLKSGEEMEELFSNIPESIANTIEIADKCNVTMEFGKYHLPKFHLADDIDPYEYLTDLCMKGLMKRYGNLSHKDRLMYELETIKSMGFVDYFLIVWDFIRFAHSKGIPVGPGRGSAAGSLVSYCLGITGVDPVKYNLLFERFLNPQRVTMPDIDIDFCFERREEVFQYVVNKYGTENVGHIVAFGTLSARSVVRDVARAINVSYAKADAVAKSIPFSIGQTIDKALNESKQLKEMYDTDSEVRQIIDISRNLEGLPRHTTTHAAGVVITENPLSDYVPLQLSEDGVQTQFTMTTLEELGLLKMDFLGLRNLTIISDTVKSSQKNNNIKIDLNTIDYNDQMVFNAISSGKTDGMFQLESAGMTEFMRRLKPRSLEDLIAGISLFRPGPADAIPTFIENKNNPHKVTYLHPILEDILKPTYGCIVYQEQVMQIVQKVAGYSLGRADLLRRAMSKKKPEIILKEEHSFIYGDEEVLGAVNNGVDKDVAKKLFDMMTDFGRYAFNKSHAAAYAVVAYQTAYLKCHYPAEFMCALMSTHYNDDVKIAQYINKMPSMGLKILPVDINKSDVKFTTDGKNIRFAFSAVKNLGTGAANEIVKERERGPFSSFTSFCSRMSSAGINKRAIECLIQCGAFDCLGGKRSQYLALFEETSERASFGGRFSDTNQISMFGNDFAYEDNLREMDEFDKETLLALEKSTVGVYVSGHPLDDYKKALSTTGAMNVAEILGTEQNDGTVVKIAGIVTDVVRKSTKSDKEMAFITVEDLTASIEVIVFSRQYSQYYNVLKKEKIVEIIGKIDNKEEQQPKIILSEAYLVNTKEQQRLYIKIPKGYENKVNTLKEYCKIYSGDADIILYFEKDKSTMSGGRSLKVTPNEVLYTKIRELFDNKCEIVLK